MLSRLFGPSRDNNAVPDKELENAKSQEEKELIKAVQEFYKSNIYECWEQFIIDGYEIYQPVLKRPYTVKDEYEKDVYDYEEFKRTFTTLMRKIKRLSDKKKKSFHIPNEIKSYEGDGNTTTERRIRTIQKVFELKTDGEKTDGEKTDGEKTQTGGKHHKYTKKSSKRSKKSKKRSTKKSKKHTTKK